MSCLILGHSGQLATHLRKILPDAIAWGRNELDLSRSDAVTRTIVDLAPTGIVNAAAYTAVDRAEEEPEIAWRVNVTAVADIANAARTLGVPVIHVSTDYVFDGTKTSAYNVHDPYGPINAYGRSKLAGELAITSLCAEHYILRTSWVFSEYGNNFVKTMLRLARERDTLRVVDDQHGVPTYAGDLARVVAKLLENASGSGLQPGTYHAVGGRAVTWHGFAQQIVTKAATHGLIDHDVDVVGIPSSQFPTPAARPANSRLRASTELGERLGVELDWETGLDTVLKALAQQ